MPAPRLSLWQKAHIVWLAFTHKRTSFPAKMILSGGVLYSLMPMDVLPDFLPVIGFSDDAIVLLLTLFAFLRMTKSLRISLENDERYGNGAVRP